MTWYDTHQAMLGGVKQSTGLRGSPQMVQLALRMEPQLLSCGKQSA